MSETIWTGWIIAPIEDEQELIAMGVTLGPRDTLSPSWEECRLPDSALNQMDKQWGRWAWGLKPEEKPAS